MLKEYREQVGRLRDKMEAFIKDHPNVGLRKMLLSGSLAKGTSLKTLNDIDVALYVTSPDAPKGEAELLVWLAEQLRKVYPNMKPEQISPGNHCVRISFRGNGLDVDVVPIYEIAGDLLGDSFEEAINRSWLEEYGRIHLGCVLCEGGFRVVSGEDGLKIEKSAPEASLMYFLMSLFKTLQPLGTVPAVDMDAYLKWIE